MKDEWEDIEMLSSGSLISYEALLDSDTKTTLTLMPFFYEFLPELGASYFLSASKCIESIKVSFPVALLNLSILNY